MTAFHRSLKPCFPARPPRSRTVAAEQRSDTTLAQFLDTPVATEKMEKKTGVEAGCQGKGLCVSALVDVPRVGWVARQALLPMLSSGDALGEV